ncbi:endolytic transglycosylase MltG [Rhizobium laguerreae]|nr:endolytic transglycosylase MltG [Rhizobium laguerreae]
MDDGDFREIRFLVQECLEDIVKELHILGCRDRSTSYRWFPASTNVDVLSRGFHFQIKDREAFTLRLDVEGAQHGLQIRKGDGVVKFNVVNPRTNAQIRECLRLNADTMEIDPSVENTMTADQIGVARLLREFRWDEMAHLDKPKEVSAPKIR